MPIDPLSDGKILSAWQHNAAPWTLAVRNHEIASRRLVTNNAIIQAVLAAQPKTALDVGCGEGWLTRALAQRGVVTLGIDAIPLLIEAARMAAPDGDYLVTTYAELTTQVTERVDAIVANFSLLGEESTEAVIQAVPGLLQPGGRFVVQTLHPVIACGAQPYRDGWRPGSWQGFNSTFSDPAPWYFRTLGSWVKLFENNGLRMIELREPLDPRSEQAASVIFVLEASG